MIIQLTSTEQRILAAIADRIIPGDEYPSASESGAVQFIDRLFHRDLLHRLSELKTGLASLNQFAEHHRGSQFADLPFAQQDQLLAMLDGVTYPALYQLFNWLVELVLEGYYSDPGNGGNQGAVSWKMVGYDPRIPGYDGSIRAPSEINP